MFYQLLATTLLIVCCSFNSFAASFKDSSSFPDEQTKQMFESFVEAYNNNNTENLKALINQNSSKSFLNRIPVDAQLGYFKRNKNRNGELTFQAFRQYSGEKGENQIMAIYRSGRTENWIAFIFIKSPDEAGKFNMIRFSSAEKPGNVDSETEISQQELITEVNQYIDRLAQKDAFSGSVLLAKGEQILLTKSAGLASKRFNVSNKVDTKFNLGSMNKMFTSVGILQLIQAGKLSLDDSLDEFIDESWLAKEITEQIKIKHLLTHTSGLGNYFNKTYRESSKSMFRELKDYKPLVENDTLSFEPGSARRYSNTGMLLLGVVIEKVSKENYFEYIRKNIYVKAGMPDSDSFEMDQPIPNLAIGYWADENSKTGWRNNIYRHVLKGGPAGGGFSTVNDLHKFALALTGYNLLNQDFTESAYSAKPDLNSPEYGYGFRVSGSAGNRIVGHGGGFPGISAKLDIYLDKGYVLVALSNYDGSARAVASKVKDLISQTKN